VGPPINSAETKPQVVGIHHPQYSLLGDDAESEQPGSHPGCEIDPVEAIIRRM
jgi:hypothetical protein